MLSPLPLVPRILAVILTTFATLTHGAPTTSPVYGPSVLLSALLTLSYADEQRPPLPCVTIHVYDPTDHFHTVYTVNQPHPGLESDQSHLVYGDSDSEAALFRSIYGASDHESDSEMPHNPYVSQQGYEPPSTQDGLTTQLGDHTATSPSADTPAYTSFLHGLLTQIRDGTDSESDGSLVPDDQSLDDAEPDPPVPLDDLSALRQPDGEASACDDACDDDSDLHNEADSCADTSDDGNPLIDYPTCANYNCNRPSNRPDVPGALCCSRCQPIPHSMHTTSCNRAWIEEMLLDLEHTAARSRAEPVIARTTVARSLAWTTTIALSLALSPLPLSCNVLAVVLAHLTPLVHAAPARLPTPPAFDIDADSGQGSGGGTRSDSRHDHHGAHATPSATVTTTQRSHLRARMTSCQLSSLSPMS